MATSVCPHSPKTIMATRVCPSNTIHQAMRVCLCATPLTQIHCPSLANSLCLMITISLTPGTSPTTLSRGPSQIRQPEASFKHCTIDIPITENHCLCPHPQFRTWFLYPSKFNLHSTTVKHCLCPRPQFRT